LTFAAKNTSISLAIRKIDNDEKLSKVQTGRSLILAIPDLRGVEDKRGSKKGSKKVRGRDQWIRDSTPQRGLYEKYKLILTKCPL
jgi:hypothetical protein